MDNLHYYHVTVCSGCSGYLSHKVFPDDNTDEQNEELVQHVRDFVIGDEHQTHWVFHSWDDKPSFGGNESDEPCEVCGNKTPGLRYEHTANVRRRWQ